MHYRDDVMRDIRAVVGRNKVSPAKVGPLSQAVVSELLMYAQTSPISTPETGTPSQRQQGVMGCTEGVTCPQRSPLRCSSLLAGGWRFALGTEGAGE